MEAFPSGVFLVRRCSMYYIGYGIGLGLVGSGVGICCGVAGLFLFS